MENKPENKLPEWCKIMNEYEEDGVKVCIYEWPVDRQVCFDTGLTDKYGHKKWYLCPTRDISEPLFFREGGIKDQVKETIVYATCQDGRRPKYIFAAVIKDYPNLMAIMHSYDKLFPCVDFHTFYIGWNSKKKTKEEQLVAKAKVEADREYYYSKYYQMIIEEDFEESLRKAEREEKEEK